MTGCAHTFDGNVNVEVRVESPRGVLGEGVVAGVGERERASAPVLELAGGMNGR